MEIHDRVLRAAPAAAAGSAAKTAKRRSWFFRPGDPVRPPHATTTMLLHGMSVGHSPSCWFRLSTKTLWLTNFGFACDTPGGKTTTIPFITIISIISIIIPCAFGPWVHQDHHHHHAVFNHRVMQSTHSRGHAVFKRQAACVHRLLRRCPRNSYWAQLQRNVIHGLDEWSRAHRPAAF